jgi:hypothetical protein
MEYKGNVIVFGSSDSETVKALKAQLNKVVGSTLDVNNGNFGASTKEVVVQFQKKNLLNPDGKVGELTWERLFNPITAKEVTASTLSERAEQIAFSQLHVREKTNKNDGVEVEQFLKAVGLGAGYAWCMAFVFWAFLKSSLELVMGNPVPKTAGVMDCYAKAKKKYLVVGEPKRGDQFIMDFGKGTGHTGIVTSAKNGRVYTIEGNTSADPTFAGEDREGNGVFERNRPVSSIKAFLRYD